MTIHVYQDLATPHNTALLDALRARADVNVISWYGHRTLAQLPWPDCVDTHPSVQHLSSSWRVRLGFVRALLASSVSRDSRFMIVGYSHAWSRIAIIWHLFIGKRFAYWTDQPQEQGRGFGRGMLRRIAYRILKLRANPMFVVGESCFSYFVDRGFQRHALVNLPICVDAQYASNAPARRKWREALLLEPDDRLIVAASRLVHAKGYDVLIDAVKMLPGETRDHLRVLLVGDGPEREVLERQICSNGLNGTVFIDRWRSPEEYVELIAAADVFVHPARSDAFGGGSLYAMSLGIPVLGTSGAGAVRERIEHLVSGWICAPDDPAGMSAALRTLLEDASMREALGLAGKHVANHWTPSTGADIIIRHLAAP